MRAATFVCGIVFALGLGVSGMLQPARIIGFLDLFGAWDPALLFVMGPAVGITLAAWLGRRGKPSPCGVPVPAKAIHDLDARLFLGAALFGVGWALSGVCPGPSIVNAARPGAFTVAVLASILAGVALSLLPIFRRPT